MREQCEVKGPGCEVFTRCVAIATGDAVRLSCPTCAIELGAPPATVQAMVEWDVEASTNPMFFDIARLEIIEVNVMTPPHSPKCPAMVEYVDITLSLAYGRGVALCQ